MSGKKAKALRRERRAAGIPDNGRTAGPNLVDLEDTRAQRRMKRFRKPELAAEMRETDPIAWQKRNAFWDWVRVWLTMPAYREGLGAPHEKIKKSD